ncbi:MAG: response regulator [Muribaculaceae bacterium]|nr:response regulator [Muribaculaceae bacterium]
MNNSIKDLKAKLFAYLTVTVLLGAVWSCRGGASGTAQGADAHEFVATDEIDSLYASYLHESGEAKLSKANAFFAALNDYELTDSLIQFSSQDKPATVNAHADYWMAEYLYDTHRPQEALEFGKTALQEAEALGDEDLQATIYSLLSISYQRLGKLEEAVQCMEICYENSAKSGDAAAQSSDLNNLAALSLCLQRNDAAKSFIDRALEIEKPLGRSDVLAVRYGIASEVYMALDRLDEAENFAREAYRLNKADGLDAKAAVRQVQLAAVLMKKSNNAEAIENLVAAVSVLEQSGNKYSLAVAHQQLGDLYLAGGSDAEAAKHYRAVCDLTSEGINIHTRQRALYGLSRALSKTDLAGAYNSLMESTQLADSINRNSDKKQLMEIENKYKESEQLRQSESRAYAQKMRFYGAVGASVLLLLAIVVLFIIIRSKNRTQRALKSVEEMRTSFFTNITHEFRTPVSVIQGLSKNIAENKVPEDEVQKAAGIIISQSNGLLDLVNQLLDISKVRSAIGDPDWRHGNIVGVMHMISEKYTYVAEQRGIELVFSPAENVINMDFIPDYVCKIMRNLISNALKFTHSGGHIYISTNVSSTELNIRVADNGDGIDSEDLPHIFEPFFQSGDAASKAAGTGIGLSLVKQMVTSMGGSISVQSVKGKGSIFTIILPLVHAKDIQALEEDEALAPTAQNMDNILKDSATDDDKPILLIVEDNDSVAYLISSSLASKYNIYYAHNGRDGLRKALDLVPDIIVTDVMMPELDGIEMSRMIKTNPLTSHVPIIVVSAKTETADRVNSFNAGVDAYLTKPFDSDELAARIANLIEQRKLLIEKYQSVIEQENLESNDMKPADRLFISNFVSAVHSLISKEKGTDMETVSSAMNMTSRSLSRKMIALTGEQPLAYINKIKVSMAKKLMDKDDSLSIADVAYRSGFEDPNYFSRIFKQIEGVTPTVYRRKC